MVRVNTPSTVYVIGATGQLGSALLASRAVPAGVRVVGLGSSDVDITTIASVRSALADLHGGDVVINAAAFTDVDGAETSREAAYAVNADGPANLAAATAAARAHLIHVSTDYVFGPAASGSRPWASPLEPSDLRDDAQPDTVYGASKLAGERAMFAADPNGVVVRTAWVFTGRAPVRDFVTTMRRLEGERDELTVVDDQRGSPTYAPDLAGGLWELVARMLAGRSHGGSVLHATNAGEATWCDLARAVFTILGADPERVKPCSTEQFPRPAPRPPYSVLSAKSWEHAGLTPLRDWRDALRNALVAPTSG
ncbi:dTDP-4-dehydrorhamnose reductase [Gordonia sp. HY002]|uniref:dTDP-4-dehydrorhamnose reductase n=1 Tax=Gordonia zhenghanii TaxID=2911516 RepID=UPI001EEFF14E|nr:dTDP-4-dehydrorhamnose reductase [Gordonia zhenghanii]MCF8570582.1 dTDP-4-dehydrorhamnose reductase [Gordonia zhenghanii]MCF8606619.1 dTDP-4-dehydrorhamnose reductase [Gordonia zhenghanii]